MGVMGVACVVDVTELSPEDCSLIVLCSRSLIVLQGAWKQGRVLYLFIVYSDLRALSVFLLRR